MKRDIRTLSHVPRWSIVRTIRRQSVAEHCFFVAIYVDWICELIPKQSIKAKLIRYALYHDLDEIVLGDIPGPCKKYLKIDKESVDAQVERMIGFKPFHSTLNLEELLIVKIADLLEGSVFLLEEQRLGNTEIDMYLADMLQNLKNNVMRLEPALWPHIDAHLDATESHGCLVARYETL